MKKVLLGVFLIALFLTSSTNAAITPTIPNQFTPKYPYIQDDVDVNYNLAWNGLKSGWEFGVFDFGGDPQQGIVLLKGGKQVDGASFIVVEENNTYTLKVTKGINKNATLDLGNSPDFSFFFKDDYYFSNLDISSLGNGMYLFSYKGAGSVTGFDLQAAPIPASFLLLSCAGGLVLVAYRKFNESEEV